MNNVFIVFLFASITSMAESKPLASPIDSIRRDSKDGAYHCPQCDTPFTRRSNLRRHYQIHMRSAVLKCEGCGEEYTSKDEFQAHSLSCYSGVGWSHPGQKPLRVVQRPFTKPEPSSSPDFLAMPPRLMNGGFADGTAYPTSTLFPNFDSPDTRFPGNYTASDFSQVMSPLSSSGSAVSANSVLSSSFDGNFAIQSSSPTTFSHRRPSTSSSMSSSSASATSSPYVHALTHPHGPCPGCYACTGRPDQPGWQPVPPTSLPALEEPVYTRRQVKEMIDVVSDCLIETMENVLTRPGQPGDILQVDSPNGQLVRSLKEDGFRQTVLSEAIPRVYYRMQNGNPRV
ncbi:hypothetical protein CVT26_009787 [Gymnopilus dilepis]|uniref:C2H2-type domain-containing protein n=1 Tax=Gymnopilus dilepis TaxID=231916 RepID=A0A409YI20_9AGAR|nr:hypothetical protein CVT26_009787 [Gymnopilus dilepis]